MRNKNKVERITLPNIKAYYKVKSSQGRVQLEEGYTHDQWMGFYTEPRKKPTHRALTDFDKGAEVIHRKDSLFSTNGAKAIYSNLVP